MNNVAPTVDVGTDLIVDQEEAFSIYVTFNAPGILDTRTANID